MSLERRTLAPVDKPGGGTALEEIPEEIGRIEYFNYGKLVNDGGHITKSGMGVTRRSEGISSTSGLLYNELLSVRMLSAGDIQEHWQKHGALVLRTLQDGSLGVTRFRFRPEAGEGRGGRVYPQCIVWKIPKDFWRRHAASIATHLATLRAEPDVENTRPSN